MPRGLPQCCGQGEGRRKRTSPPGRTTRIPNLGERPLDVREAEGKPRAPSRVSTRQGRVNRLAHIGYHDNTTAPVSMAAADPIQLASFLFFPGLHPTPSNSLPACGEEGPRKTRRGPSCHSRARGETRVQTGGRNCRRKGRRFRQGRVEDWNKEERSRVGLKDGGRL